MAIAIHSGRRQVTYRPPLMRIRTAESNAGLPFIMVVLLTVGITAWLLSSQMLEVRVPRSLAASVQPAAPSRPAEGAVPVDESAASVAAEELGAVVAAEPEAATPAESAVAVPPEPARANAPEATEPGTLAVGARARVANTDNMGVVFYSAPRDGARMPAGLLEGTEVTVLGVSGSEWAEVQSDSKKTGWVRSAYLTPTE